MSQSDLQIGAEFSYGAKLNQRTATLREDCLNRYQAHIETVEQLDAAHPVFLDANVLLGYYQLPIAARQKLYQFLDENKARIYICDQVRREFLKHKNHVARTYAKHLQVLRRPTPYQQEVPTWIADFLEDNDDVLAAYPDFKKDLEGVQSNSQSILKQLERFSKDRFLRCRAQLLEQDIADLLPDFQLLPSLNKEEFNFLRQEFNALKQEVEQHEKGNFPTVVDAYLYQFPNNMFPGIGDIKKKPKAPYGDYFIFHEIMKWVAIHQPELPVVFLTNDVTKSDWLNREQRPYIRYLENMYLNAADIFYILHAEATFSKVLSTNMAHLVLKEEVAKDAESAVFAALKEEPNDQITPVALKQLLKRLYPNRTRVEEPVSFWEDVIADWKEDFELTSLWELKREALEHYHLLVQTELGRYEIYDQLDALERTLDFVYE